MQKKVVVNSKIDFGELFDAICRIPGAVNTDSDITDGAQPGTTSYDNLPPWLDEIKRKYYDSAIESNESFSSSKPQTKRHRQHTFYISPKHDNRKVLLDVASKIDSEYKVLPKLNGIEAYGYYVTFHQTKYQWGIYLPASRILLAAAAMFGELDIDTNTKIQLAKTAILAHEQMHFAMDLTLAQLEFLQNKPICSAIRRNAPGKIRDLIEEEEGCANAYMLLKLKNIFSRRELSQAYKTLTDFVERMPAGYSEGTKIAKSLKSFEKSAELLLVENIITARLAEVPTGIPLWPLLSHNLKFNLDICPIIEIYDLDNQVLTHFGLNFIGSINEVMESASFNRKLLQLGEAVSKLWVKTKKKLACSTKIHGLDFKPWPLGGDGCFSVRLSRDIRAHIVLDQAANSWRAVDIGHHKPMGHG